MKSLTFSALLAFILSNATFLLSPPTRIGIEPKLAPSQILEQSLFGAQYSRPGVYLSGEFVVLEAELHRRFKTKFRGSYDTIEPISEIVILMSDVKVGDKISSLPSSIAQETYTLNNNSDDTQTKRIVVKVKTEERETISFEKAITTGNENKFKLGFEIKGLRAESETTSTRQTSITNKTEATTTRTREYEEQFEQKIGPRKRLVITIKREVLTDIYALQGTIVFDGRIKVKHQTKDVYACGPLGTGRCSRWKNKDRVFNLSDILSVEERTLSLAGKATISSSANTKTETTYTATDLSTGE